MARFVKIAATLARLKAFVKLFDGLFGICQNSELNLANFYAFGETIFVLKDKII